MIRLLLIVALCTPAGCVTAHVHRPETATLTAAQWLEPPVEIAADEPGVAGRVRLPVCALERNSEISLSQCLDAARRLVQAADAATREELTAAVMELRTLEHAAEEAVGKSEVGALKSLLLLAAPGGIPILAGAKLAHRDSKKELERIRHRIKMIEELLSDL